VKVWTGATLLWSMALSLGAQQVTLGTVSQSPGQTASLSVQFTSGGAQISGVQFDLIYNTAVLAITATEGAVASAAGKSFATSNPAPNDLRVLIVGFDQTLIGNGDITDLKIQIAANAAPGNYPLTLSQVSATNPLGTAIIPSATSGSVTVTGATLLPVIAGISNLADGQIVVAPNAWVSIYGSNFAAAGFTDTWTKTVVNGNLPTTLDSVMVTIGGQLAYMEYVSAGQIDVLLPDVGLGPLQATVTTPAGTSAPMTVNSQQYSPAFFPWPNGQPVATHLDYSYAAQNGTLGTASVPAAPGETIILWGTGFGPTNPAYPTGVAVPSTSAYLTATPVTVTIGGSPATVVSAVLTSGSAGVYQIAVTVPATLPNGNYTVIASINGAQTPAATLTVQD
jgi:uncharacterized protein (TIGR03437 family)